MRRIALLLAIGLLAATTAPAVAGASPGSPVGSFDQVVPAPTGLEVSGWVQDPDSPDSVTVHVYVDGAFAGSDVANFAYPGTVLRGFFVTVPASAGAHSVCVYALSIGPGDNTLLGCKQGLKPSVPYGAVDSLVMDAGGPYLRGWAIDPDTVSPIQVHVYVDGQFATQGRANMPSPDVMLATKWEGHHRFELSLPLTPGPHRICAYGINVGEGDNGLLACRVLDHPVNPFGALELATLNHQTGKVNVHGWAIDPDTGAALAAHFWADGVPVGDLNSARSRPDIAAAFRFGDLHGFANAIAVPPGAATLCAYAVNIGPGVNTLLGCLPIDRSGNPLGAMQLGSTGCIPENHDGPVDVWAIDPDTDEPVDVDIYIRGSETISYVTTIRADQPGPDPSFGSLFPQFGPDHWLKSCSHFSRYSYYAINAPGTPGVNRFIGAEPWADHGAVGAKMRS